MRSLLDLLATDDGRGFLAGRGLLTDLDDFVSCLQDPVSPDLNTLLGFPPATRLVHIGQQVCSDYAPLTLTKFSAGARMAGYDDATPVIIWHDAFRAEAERYGMRLVVPSGTKQIGIWFASRSYGGQEPRFIPVGRAAVEEVLRRLGAWVTSRMQDRPKAERTAAQSRIEALAESVLARGLETLGQANAAFAEFLLVERLGVAMPTVLLSAMIDDGVLTTSVSTYLERLDDVIAVFNEAVAELTAQDVDPQVRPLGADHLPVHFSCPQDGSRLRLAHDKSGGDHYGVATCRCGTGYRFHLGSTTLGLGELADTGRWSPDVSLPIHHNDHASGWIVGRSTALYGLVLDAVNERVLGGRPIPGWIPPDLLAAPRPGRSSDSLLVEYLTR